MIIVVGDSGNGDISSGAGVMVKGETGKGIGVSGKGETDSGIGVVGKGEITGVIKCRPGEGGNGESGGEGGEHQLGLRDLVRDNLILALICEKELCLLKAVAELDNNLRFIGLAL